MPVDSQLQLSQAFSSNHSWLSPSLLSTFLRCDSSSRSPPVHTSVTKLPAKLLALLLKLGLIWIRQNTTNWHNFGKLSKTMQDNYLDYLGQYDNTKERTSTRKTQSNYALISLKSSVWAIFVKTQRNSAELNSKQLKSNFVGLDTVPTCSPPHPTPNVEIMVKPSSLAERKYSSSQKLFRTSPAVCQIYL